MIEYSKNAPGALQKLSDTGLTLADPDQDIRGRKVVDTNDEPIGHVTHLFIDDSERKVRMVEVGAGGFLGLGERHFLIPVDAITAVTDHQVRVNETRERVIGSPAYDPPLIVAPTQTYWEPFYGYYGLSPYWADGYNYPHFPISPMTD